MATQWMLQHVEPARDAQEAREMLEGLKLQGGFKAGRILPKGAGKPDRVQAFFEDVACEWYPSGASRVIVFDSILAECERA